MIEFILGIRTPLSAVSMPAPLQESGERHTEPPSGGHEIHRIQGGQVDRVTPSDAKVGDLEGQD